MCSKNLQSRGTVFRIKKYLLIFLICFSTLCAEQGKLIVLYGTPCAGKSTLAKSIEQALPGNFKPFKRTEIAHHLRIDNIEKITGVRPRDFKEAVRIEKSLSKKHQQKFSHDFKEMALQPAILEMEKRLNNGENLIFDICLYHKKQLEQLQHLNPTYVLVYSPLPHLSIREQQRAQSRNRNLSEQNKTRKYILSGFSRLYKPVPNTEGVDTLSKDEVVDYYLRTRQSWTQDDYSKMAQKILTQFHLKSGVKMGITPKWQPSLFINTSKLSPDESVLLIKHRVESL